MQRFLIRLWLYFIGVRFYRTLLIPNKAEVLKTTFELVDEQNIEFLFYRETFSDICYRKGKFKNKLYYSFIIQGKFPETLENSLIRFNGQFFFFKGSWLRWVNTEILADELLRVYLDYLREEHN